jgi:hypothetical protein
VPNEVVGNYLWLLDRIHRHLLPTSYLEIGVCEGRSLALVLPGTLAIGVDPTPRIRYAVGHEARVFPLTSNDFFASHAEREFGSARLDMGFIDGLHLCEMSLSDFAQMESLCHPGSVILVHDVYPIDAESAARERTTSMWSGDVWKAILALRRFRPDLRLSSVKIGPTGLGIITRLEPGSQVLIERYEEIVDWMGQLDYSTALSDKDDALDAVDADPVTIRGLLPAPFQVRDRDALVRRRALRLPPTASELREEAIRRARLSRFVPAVNRVRRGVKELSSVRLRAPRSRRTDWVPAARA